VRGPAISEDLRGSELRLAAGWSNHSGDGLALSIGGAFMQVSRGGGNSRLANKTQLAMLRDDISRAVAAGEAAGDIAAEAAPAEGEIGVIGLGYVGMPLALALARSHGARIVGFDIDGGRIGAPCKPPTIARARRRRASCGRRKTTSA
jgi:hypothetical protein